MFQNSAWVVRSTAAVLKQWQHVSDSTQPHQAEFCLCQTQFSAKGKTSDFPFACFTESNCFFKFIKP